MLKNKTFVIKDVYGKEGVPEDLQIDETKFKADIDKKFLKGRSSKLTPTCYILAGQCGSGKSTLEGKLLDKLGSFKENVVIADTDTIRVCHENDKKFFERYGRKYIHATDFFVGKWNDYVKNSAIQRKYDLIIHDILIDTKNSISLLERLKAEGYNIKINVMAVDNLSSELSTIRRHVKGAASDKNLGRYISKTLHDQGYIKMVDTLREIYKSGLADIEIYTRDDTRLYPGEQVLSPIDALTNYLDRKWDQKKFNEFITLLEDTLVISNKVKDEKCIERLGLIKKHVTEKYPVYANEYNSQKKSSISTIPLVREQSVPERTM